MNGAGFTLADWLVLGVYFFVLAFTGWLFTRSKKGDTESYFLGGRSMPAWAVAISILATSLSAATFIGGPEQAFKGDLTYLATNIGMVIAAVVIAVWFIPAFYRARVATVYELLDTRFGPRAKRAASGMFMIGRVFASGARLFIVALPASLIMFGEPEAGSPIPAWQLSSAIAAMTAVGIAYTLVGGISSVIWSDVIQTGVFLAAVTGAIVLLVDKIPIGPAEIAEVLRNAPGAAEGSSKLTVIETSTDPSQPFTIWAVLIGFTLLGIASYGTDQDLVQRMLTCKSARAGSWSVISAQLIAVPVVLLFMTVGLLLYLFYTRPDVMGSAMPTNTPGDERTVFLSFILSEMPPGMTGLMMAGLFAAGLSSLNSAINAMSSTFVSDFYKRWRTERGEGHYVRVGRFAVVGWGLILGLFAVLCVPLQEASGDTLINFALGVMVFAYSGLLGVYFTALFTKRGSERTVLAALVVGFVAVLAMQPYTIAALFPIPGISPIVVFPTQPFTHCELLPIPIRDDLTGIGKVVHFVANLAFPWKLTIATSLSFATCQIGKSRSGAAA